MQITTEFRIVIVTIDDYNLAIQISKILISEQLAACCNIIPNITSIYRWEGEIHSDSEFLILIKTTQENLENIEKRITELHSYDVPEIISFEITSGNKPYLNWISDSLLK
jgi:periplasmic divalent cation tolerance protein